LHEGILRLKQLGTTGQVGFVVDKVALGQVFSEYFSFPCQSSFHHLFHIHPHLSYGAGTIGQKWPQYKGLSPTPLAIQKEPLLCIKAVYSVPQSFNAIRGWLIQRDRTSLHMKWFTQSPRDASMFADERVKCSRAGSGLQRKISELECSQRKNS
jgi:hypothetical protein